MGYSVPRSYTNFLYLPLSSEQEMEDTYQRLLDGGILVGKMGPFGAPNALRITVGDRPANQKIIKCLNSSFQILG